MKITVIRGRGLASLYDPFEIRLDRGPLAQSGLYSISGQTGAGKSTILDAMCLALFGETPRLRGRSKSKIGRLVAGKDDQRLSDRDPRALLSRGCPEGFAEVEFEGIDQELYRARWSVRRSRRSSKGRVQPATIDLFRVADDRRLSDSTTRKTLAEISAKLGLSFDQFCRSVLLAQGDFAAFLRADDKERADLLERMTGTEIYRELSVACHRRNREEQQSVGVAKSAVAALQVWDEAEQKARRLAKDQACAARDRAKDNLDLHRRQKDALTRRAELEAQLQKAQRLVKQDTQALQEAQGLRDELQNLRTLETARPLFEKERELANKKERLVRALFELSEQAKTQQAQREAARAALAETERQRAELEAQRQVHAPQLEQARRLDAQLARLNAEHDRAHGARKELQARGAELEQVKAQSQRKQKQVHTEIHELAQAWPQLDASLRLWERKDELTEVLEDLLALQVEHREKEDRIKSKRREHDGLDEQVKVLLASAQTLQTELDDAQEDRGQDARAQGEQDDRLQEGAARCRRALEQTHALLRQREALALQVSKRREYSLELADLGEQEAKAYKEKEQGEQALQLLEARKQEALGLREEAYALELMREHRGLLRPGKPCPLCGATEHPSQTQSDTSIRDAYTLASKRLETLQAEVQALLEKRQEVEKRLVALHTRKEPLPQQLRVLDEQIKAAQQRLRAQVHAARDALALWPSEVMLQSRALLYEITDALDQDRGQEEVLVQVSGWINQVDGFREALDEELAKVNARRQAQLAKRQAQERNRKRLEDLRRRHSEQMPLLAAVAAKLATLTSEDKALVDRSKTLKARLVVLWKEVPGPWREGIPSLSGLRDQVQQWLTAVQQAGDAQRALQQRLEALSTDLETKVQDVRLMAMRIQDADEALAGIVTERNTLQETRAGYLGGQSVDAFVAAQEAKSQALRRVCEQGRETCETLERAHVELTAKRGSLDQQKQSLAAEHAQAKERVEAQLDALALRHAELSEKLRTAPARIQTLVSTLDRLDKALTSSQAQLQSRTQDLAAHKEACPELVDPETNARALQSAIQAFEASQAKVLDLEYAIEDNEKKKRKLASLESAHQEQLQRARRWAKLNDLIGHSEGLRFQRFAQGLSLDRLLLLANRHLRDIDRRYRLIRVQGDSLDLQVVDTMMGDEVRSIHSLSGGESFLISLALALGLSSLSAMHTRVESLFIDEGFGTLDRESLDQVLAALDALQATGRQVGLISHVDGMAEQLGAQVKVLACGHGKSVVQVQGCAGL